MWSTNSWLCSMFTNFTEWVCFRFVCFGWKLGEFGTETTRHYPLRTKKRKRNIRAQHIFLLLNLYPGSLYRITCGIQFHLRGNQFHVSNIQSISLKWNREGSDSSSLHMLGVIRLHQNPSRRKIKFRFIFSEEIKVWMLVSQTIACTNLHSWQT